MTIAYTGNNIYKIYIIVVSKTINNSHQQQHNVRLVFFTLYNFMSWAIGYSLPTDSGNVIIVLLATPVSISTVIWSIRRNPRLYRRLSTGLLQRPTIWNHAKKTLSLHRVGLQNWINCQTRLQCAVYSLRPVSLSIPCSHVRLKSLHSLPVIKRVELKFYYDVQKPTTPVLQSSYLLHAAVGLSFTIRTISMCVENCDAYPLVFTITCLP